MYPRHFGKVKDLPEAPELDEMNSMSLESRDGVVLRSSLSVHIRTFVSGTRPFADVFDLMKSGKHFFKKAARSSFRLQSELARVSLAALLSRAW
jgi:hypothetical protein